MAIEIERKFLVVGDSWRTVEGVYSRQGYLCGEIDRVVRVRVIHDRGYLTVKGRTVGVTRYEYEYEIPVDDADQMLDDLCEKPLIEKYRYTLDHGGQEWEIDEFLGQNAGLIVAEVELESLEQEIVLPPWVGSEVSDDPRYFNINLMKKPYCTW